MSEQPTLDDMVKQAREEISPFFDDPHLEKLADRTQIRYLAPNAVFEQMIVGQHSHGALMVQEDGRNVLLVQPNVGYAEMRRVMFKAYQSLMSRDFIIETQAKKTSRTVATPNAEAREIMLLESLPFAFDFYKRRADEEAQGISPKNSFFLSQLNSLMSFYFTSEHEPGQPAKQAIANYLHKIIDRSVEGDVSISAQEMAELDRMQFEPEKVDFVRRRIETQRSRICSAAREYALMFAATIFEEKYTPFNIAINYSEGRGPHGKPMHVIKVSLNYPDDFKLDSRLAGQRISDFLARKLYVPRKPTGLTPMGEESLYEMMENILGRHMNNAKSKAIARADQLGGELESSPKPL